MSIQGIVYKNQLRVPLNYKGLELDTELRLDVLVEDILCVELKAQEGILPVQKPKGILINFHCVNIFKEGQKTLVNNLFAQLPDE